MTHQSNRHKVLPLACAVAIIIILLVLSRLVPTENLLIGSAFFAGVVR